MTPWREQQRIADAIKEACGGYSIPWDMRRDPTWKSRMQVAAGDAISRLRSGATRTEMQAAAQSALAPLMQEFDSIRTRLEIVDEIWKELPEANYEEKEEGKEAVRTALARFPIGVSRRELERARATALAPIREAIATRRARETRASLLMRFQFRTSSWPDGIQKQALATLRRALDELPERNGAAQAERIMDQVAERFRGLCQREERKYRLIVSGLGPILFT